MSSDTGNRTPGYRVRGDNVSHYTISETGVAESAEGVRMFDWQAPSAAKKLLLTSTALSKLEICQSRNPSCTYCYYNTVHISQSFDHVQTLCTCASIKVDVGGGGKRSGPMSEIVDCKIGSHQLTRRGAFDPSRTAPPLPLEHLDAHRGVRAMAQHCVSLSPLTVSPTCVCLHHSNG
ncbi:hypothetical protein BDY19DRAFT_580847 [Irpex rosettiformis]|uniref:Uncharacterized protein n=1 Tax=Irpex rosettiformis TaxID=378272 RepID=A0ACB8UCX0_9APHY|nr:hypothetical protein BDY19DRAFT_580847 [Irpex rosettiformis]